MPNNYTQATLSPVGVCLTQDQMEWLKVTGASFDVAKRNDKPGHYVFWEESFNECPDDELFDESPVEKLKEMGDLVDVLRDILKNVENCGIKELRIEGAHVCSRMREGEFGGFVLLVTRKEYVWYSTGSLALENGQVINLPQATKFDDCH